MFRPVLLALLARLTLLISLALLAACAPRPGPEVLAPHPEAAATAPRMIRVYAASNRAAVTGYENLPAFATTYRYYDISVPPEAPGEQIAYPEGPSPDPARSYVVLDSGVLTRAAFLAATRGGRGGPEGEAGLYIHGYNTSYQEALFRLAQIAVEADAGVAPVLFSWPSTGKPLEYEGDRQAALFSRGELTSLITDLTAGHRRLLVFGHSMGAFLTMESLRTLKLSGREDVLARLDVVLAAPDIDVFAFIRLMQEVGPLPAPMVILSSPDDRALALSSRIAGGRPRLGALPANSPLVAQAARRANIQIIDISEVQADPMRHLRYIRLAELYTRQLEAPPELRLPGAFIFDALSRSLVAP
ncbi:alpha/beta hydrolase [Pseudooceanicola sp. 200-1SW]|uniref:alpha/beta hydrolase n=1 Tax=Pseudooceanicola sp. 200-1SW TaxID=3425949 RepID=UPI003D7FFDA6